MHDLQCELRDLKGEVQGLKERLGIVEIDLTGLKLVMAKLADAVSVGFREIGESNRRIETMLQQILSRHPD